MGFNSLIPGIDPAPSTPVKKKPASSGPKRAKTTPQTTGCDGCPLDKVPGINKVMGKIAGKDIIIFAQSPGPEENDAKLELVGKSGKFLWTELKRIGILRSMCDIQNVVRCYPADLVESSYSSQLKMRNPSTVEINHCSFHTDVALQKIKAKQIIVLGVVAAKALLKTKSLPTNKIFWSDQLKAKVYLLDHPAFFIRGYATDDRLAEFRSILDQVKKDRTTDASELSDHFAYLKQQDYQLVLNQEQALRAAAVIRKYAAKGRRISMDIENLTDDTILCNGMSPKPGTAYVFVFCHKDQPAADGRAVRAIADEIVTDASVQKVMHYGCSDSEKYREDGIAVAGFNSDTQYSEYLRFSGKRKYGLAEIAEQRFPKFSGYKMVVLKEMLAGIPDVPPKIQNALPSDQYKWLTSSNHFDMGKLSLETLRLYNGADADLTKRIEISNKEVPGNLLKLYVDLSFVLYRMEPNAPWLDYEQQEMLNVVYTSLEHKQLADIRKTLGKPTFNPASPKQVYDVIYKDLELEYPFHKGKPDTRKATLLMMGRTHPFPLQQVEVRKTSKAKSTYIEGYRTVADFNNGRLRTTWRATGTRTGRLSSGGDKGKAKTKTNLQNIHGNPQIQNMLVADKRWRIAYRAFGKIVRKFPRYVKRVKYLAQFEELKKAKKLPPDAKPAPQSQLTTVQQKQCGHALIRWVRQNMADLKTFFILDYGQIEVRVAAQMSGDKNLIADCASGDIHTTVGSVMTGWDADRIKHDKAVRTLTKNVHFGILFGISKDNLFEFVKAMSPPDMQDRITREEVSQAYDNYFKRYKGIARFIASQREFGRANGYVETMFGMKQQLYYQHTGDDTTGDEDDTYDDDLTDTDAIEKKTASPDNQAVNGPVQGTAHQLLTCALVNCYRQPEKYKILGTPILDVHDALYFGVNLLDLVAAHQKGKYLLEQESLATMRTDFPNIKWQVPIASEAEAGLRLGCKVDLEAGFALEDFILSWYWKCRKQNIELKADFQKASVYARKHLTAPATQPN